MKASGFFVYSDDELVKYLAIAVSMIKPEDLNYYKGVGLYHMLVNNGLDTKVCEMRLVDNNILFPHGFAGNSSGILGDGEESIQFNFSWQFILNSADTIKFHYACVVW